MAEANAEATLNRVCTIAVLVSKRRRLSEIIWKHGDKHMLYSTVHTGRKYDTVRAGACRCVRIDELKRFQYYIYIYINMQFVIFLKVQYIVRTNRLYCTPFSTNNV